MTNAPLHVLVVGGGIGGLCLAQGLREVGISVAVYEQERTADSRPEGYRIHLDPAGTRSLRACLPEPLWQAFLATCPRGGSFGFLTERLDELVVVEEPTMYPGSGSDPAEDHYAVDRRVLRRLLLAGLDEVMHFDARFVRYEHINDGRVAAVFADGRRAVGDLLVGADGTRSRVRAQYLPRAAPVHIGATGIAHKLLLTEHTRSWVPPRLQAGMNKITTDASLFLFTSAYNPPAGINHVLQQAVGASVDRADVPYVLCALVATATTVPGNLAAIRRDDLPSVVAQMVTHWHPTLRRLLADSDPASLTAIEFTASPQLPPWPSTNITLLGDAIHTMPPIGGLGGNTALRDARLLTAVLTAVHHGHRDLLQAMADYEHKMRAYGYTALRSALALTHHSLATNPIRTRALRSWFRLCRIVPALRHQTFRSSWNTHAKPHRWEKNPIPR